MKPSIVIALIIAVATMSAPGTAQADTKAFDASMQPVLEQYLAIQKALSADTIKGVAEKARKIVALSAGIDPATVTGEHAMHYRDIPKNLKAAASDVARQKDIEGVRKAFKELSKPMAMWATMSKPAGINVVYCSMYQGSWLQKDKLIANPYYGKSMLRCGEIVSGKDAAKSPKKK